MNVHKDTPDHKDSQDIPDQQASQDLMDPEASRVRRDIQALKDRMERLESQALRDNLALSALLDRLEIVVVNVMQFWSTRITQLNKMTIILGSIALGQLLLVFPQIAQIVRNLL